MEYRETRPSAALATVVDRIWMLEGPARIESDDPQPVLPDGRPELVIHLGDRFERIVHTDLAMARGGQRILQPSVIFAGQLTEQLLLRPTGRVAVLGIRFLPHGPASVLKTPQHLLAGRTLDVGALSPRLERDLRAVDHCGGDLDRAADVVQHVLIRWLRPDGVDPRVRYAVDAIDRARGRVSVDRLAAATGITRRHLERQFLATVGITPKRLARITRFQRALRLLERPHTDRTGAETALTCGYTDQSHFIREFRALAGRTPSQHLLHTAELTGLFIGDLLRRNGGA
jgi:AraC-like DNA-binding protein